MFGKTKGKVTNRFPEISHFTMRTFILINNIGDKERGEGFFVSKHGVNGVPIGEYEPKNCVRVAFFQDVVKLFPNRETE